MHQIGRHCWQYNYANVSETAPLRNLKGFPQSPQMTPVEVEISERSNPWRPQRVQQGQIQVDLVGNLVTNRSHGSALSRLTRLLRRLGKIIPQNGKCWSLTTSQPRLFMVSTYRLHTYFDPGTLGTKHCQERYRCIVCCSVCVSYRLFQGSEAVIMCY